MIYKIEYDDIPDNISHSISLQMMNGSVDDNSFNFKKYEIIFYSSNKADVEVYIQAKKYNL